MEKAERLIELKRLLDQWHSFTLELDEADRMLSKIYASSVDSAKGQSFSSGSFVVTSPSPIGFIFPYGSQAGPGGGGGGVGGSSGASGSNGSTGLYSQPFIGNRKIQEKYLRDNKDTDP